MPVCWEELESVVPKGLYIVDGARYYEKKK
jgi:hypothetical protein